MKELLVMAKGKRTYAVVGVGIFLLMGQWIGFYKLPEEIYGACIMLALWYLRSAIPSENKPS